MCIRDRRIATDAFGNALGNSVVEEMRLAGSGAGSTDDQVRKIFRKHTMNDVQWLVAQERMRGLGQYAAIALERTASNDASTLREIGCGPEGETYWNNDAVSYPVKDPHIGVREPLRSVASGAINEDPGYISNINSILTSDLSVGNKVNMAWGMTKYAFRGSSTCLLYTSRPQWRAHLHGVRHAGPQGGRRGCRRWAHAVCPQRRRPSLAHHYLCLLYTSQAEQICSGFPGAHCACFRRA